MILQILAVPGLMLAARSLALALSRVIPLAPGGIKPLPRPPSSRGSPDASAGHERAGLEAVCGDKPPTADGRPPCAQSP